MHDDGPQAFTPRTIFPKPVSFALTGYQLFYLVSEEMNIFSNTVDYYLGICSEARNFRNQDSMMPYPYVVSAFGIRGHQQALAQ